MTEETPTALAIRLAVIEQQVHQLQTQLQMYVPVRENELQLQTIQGTVSRIELEIQDAKKQLTDLNERLLRQKDELLQKDTEQREKQDKLQIKALWFIVSTVIGILTALLVAYLSHFPH